MSLDVSWDHEVAFGFCYSGGLFVIHMILFTIAISKSLAENNSTLDLFYAGFGKLWTSPWNLCLQAIMCIVLVYWTKRKNGALPTLPNEAGKAKIRQSSGSQKIDFTKGPLLRRVMQRIKYCKMKLSPIQYIAKG